MKKIVILACVSLLFYQTGHATTASVKGLGMGGACVSYPMDSGVIAFNPAGITSLRDRVDTGCYFVNNFGSVKVAGNAIPSVNRKDNNRLKAAQGPETGAVYHVLPQLAIGCSIYNEKDIRVTYKRSFSLLGTSPVGLQYTLQILAPTIAMKLFEYHSFSVTLNYMVQRLKIKGLETIANTFIPFSEFPDFVTNRGYDYVNGTAVTLGYLGRFFDNRFNVGFAWRSKGRMGRFGKYKGFIAQRGKQDVAEIYRVGVSATPICDWTVALDFELARISKIPSLNDHFNLFSPYLLGSNQGPGFGLKNQYILRMGINYDWSPALSLRLGYRTANINFSGADVAPNLLTLDVTNNFITSGATYQISETFEVSGILVYGFRGSRRGPLPGPLGGGQINVEQQNLVTAIQLSTYY